MKRLFALIVIGMLGVYVYIPNKTQIDTSVDRWVNFSFCDRPITYKIGKIDDRFGITEKQFSVSIDKAAKLWGNAINKELFKFDPEGNLTISLIYDTRHDILRAIYKIESAVDDTKDFIGRDTEQYEKIKTELSKQLEELNIAIDYWNSKGGAPLDVYEDLVEKQNYLKDKIEQLNSLADNINTKVEQINTDIHVLNDKVNYFNAINKIHPEKGLYTSGINEIEIYFYASEDDLIHTLAHEMGHSLGIGHVIDSEAIMNPVTSEKLKITQQDKIAITTICENRNRLDLIKSDLQNFLYSYISYFKFNELD